MSYLVRLGGRAKRELDDLSREIIARIDERITELATNPRPPGCKKLRSRTREGWRIRVGDYRILYHIDDERREVIIYRISHRRDVYDRS